MNKKWLLIFLSILVLVLVASYIITKTSVFLAPSSAFGNEDLSANSLQPTAQVAACPTPGTVCDATTAGTNACTGPSPNPNNPNLARCSCVCQRVGQNLSTAPARWVCTACAAGCNPNSGLCISSP